jgi:hypothetical protein
LNAPRRTLLRALLAAALFGLLGGCASQLGTITGTGDGALDRQLERIEHDRTPTLQPRRIFIGLALNSRAGVFDADVRLMDQTLRALYGTSYRSILLSNLRIHSGDRELPLASIEHVDQVFAALQRIRRPDDRFIVLLSTHGTRGLLEVEQPALYPTPRSLPSRKLAGWMSQLEPNRSWLMISACYSGSHLPALTQPHLLAMTAASDQRLSFGCSTRDKNTWFVHELAASLREGGSFGQLWQRTQERIAARERANKLLASEPQRRYGSALSGLDAVALTDF